MCKFSVGSYKKNTGRRLFDEGEERCNKGPETFVYFSS